MAPPHILVVDDDFLIRNTLKLYLEREGYLVSLASNGMEAIKCLEQAAPDVLILDLFMPEMDGFETLRRLNHAARRARILVISGGGSAAHCEFITVASKLGADSVLKKPFTAPELAAAVEALLPPPYIMPDMN
jgi:DNA-binding response OmpR family regulator